MDYGADFLGAVLFARFSIHLRSLPRTREAGVGTVVAWTVPARRSRENLRIAQRITART